jgi:hypothetical protein
VGLTRSLCERHLVIRAVEKPPQNDADARSVTSPTRSIVTYPKRIRQKASAKIVARELKHISGSRGERSAVTNTAWAST